MAESLANAVKYAGMLSSQDVNGDSAMATANAEMVLTAETAINDAVTAADTAIKEANAAKLAAEDIENEAEKDAVMRLLDDAIETAMEVKTAAQAIIDGTTLSAQAVAEVEGANDGHAEYRCRCRRGRCIRGRDGAGNERSMVVQMDGTHA